MRKEIIIGVVSPLVTTAILWMMGLLGDKLEEGKLQLLLNKLKSDSEFMADLSNSVKSQINQKISEDNFRIIVLTLNAGSNRGHIHAFIATDSDNPYILCQAVKADKTGGKVKEIFCSPSQHAGSYGVKIDVDVDGFLTRDVKFSLLIHQPDAKRFSEPVYFVENG